MIAPQEESAGEKRSFKKEKASGRKKFAMMAAVLSLALLVSGVLYLKPRESSLSSTLSPAQWDGETPVSEILFSLGQKRPDHFRAASNEDQVRVGETLVRKGRLRDANGGATPRISFYFRCADCHNTVREDAELASISSPEVKLAYAVENDIPLLQGSTFAGMVNRESWYNDDYAKKYRFSPTVQFARSSLVKAIELCCEKCSQGRPPEEWELEALLAYFWTLQWKVKDLDLTGEEFADWKTRAVSGNAPAELIADIKSTYAAKSPATFADVPEDAKSGFPIEGEPDLQLGKSVFTHSCLHCHDPAEGAAETYFRDKKKSRAELARKFRSNSKSSAYHYIRIGTHPLDEQRLYMPNFTRERLSDFQIESLRAYLEQ